jgi:hypothetical protein
MQPWFTATARFDPNINAQEWERYVAGSGLTQLEEVVTLDTLLCPPVLREVKPTYWPHIANEDYMLQFFTSLEFLLGEVAEIPSKNVLCVFRNPETAPVPPKQISWSFIGYDLVDVFGGNSALTNCGGFPKSFSDSELNSKGLLSSRERAYEVQHSLRREYGDEPHADCHVWAIFRGDGL